MSQEKFSSVAAAVLCGAILTACSLPTSGPRGDAIRLGMNRDTDVPYCLLKARPEVVAAATRYQHRLAGRFDDRRPPSTVRIGVGDVIGVTLFESAAGGLFFSKEGGSRQGNFIPLPNQTVDESGLIFIPYAGSIRAAGRTTSAIQRSIVSVLKNKALKPQALVSIVEQRDARISVVGEVRSPSRFPVSASGERLIDAIARSGGISGPGQETWVLLERDGKVAIAPFAALLHEPGNNIYVRPQDTIYVFREPQTFVAFGATGTQGQFPFNTWKLSFAEALGKAGGLNDALADPSWVFLYRFEDKKVLDEIDHDCALASFIDEPLIPVIYQFDLRDASGYFLARQMRMKNKDVIYASNARSVEVNKFLDYIRGINATVEDPITTAISAYTLKAAARGTSSAAIVIGAP
jgi:polysaccharide export outer membrane protein